MRSAVLSPADTFSGVAFNAVLIVRASVCYWLRRSMELVPSAALTARAPGSGRDPASPAPGAGAVRPQPCPWGRAARSEGPLTGPACRRPECSCRGLSPMARDDAGLAVRHSGCLSPCQQQNNWQKHPKVGRAGLSKTDCEAFAG